MEKHRLNSLGCIMSGDIKINNTFSNCCGFWFVHSNIFFKE